MASKQPHALTTEQIETIASPVRRALFEEILAREEATARDLAPAIGRTFTAVYPHLDRLYQEFTRLFRKAKRRRGRRRMAITMAYWPVQTK